MHLWAKGEIESTTDRPIRHHVRCVHVPCTNTSYQYKYAKHCTDAALYGSQGKYFGGEILEVLGVQY